MGDLSNSCTSSNNGFEMVKRPSDSDEWVMLDSEELWRCEQLVKVHTLMDDDGSGFIEAPEMLLLGKARRQLGHKQGEWNEAMNNKIVAKIDKDGDGKIHQTEFAEYFSGSLPQNKTDFKQAIQKFMAVAEHCRSNSSKPSPSPKSPKQKEEDAFQSRLDRLNSPSQSSPRAGDASKSCAAKDDAAFERIPSRGSLSPIGSPAIRSTPSPKRIDPAEQRMLDRMEMMTVKSPGAREKAAAKEKASADRLKLLESPPSRERKATKSSAKPKSVDPDSTSSRWVDKYG